MPSKKRKHGDSSPSNQLGGTAPSTPIQSPKIRRECSPAELVYNRATSSAANSVANIEMPNFADFLGQNGMFNNVPASPIVPLSTPLKMHSAATVAPDAPAHAKPLRLRGAWSLASTSISLLRSFNSENESGNITGGRLNSILSRSSRRALLSGGYYGSIRPFPSLVFPPCSYITPIRAQDVIEPEEFHAPGTVSQNLEELFNTEAMYVSPETTPSSEGYSSESSGNTMPFDLTDTSSSEDSNLDSSNSDDGYSSEKSL
ncbi:MAG: hypothetical protein HON55_05045 [Legionellales bacterium]|nr:hypothetical protein [Legionellales bacterium]